MRLSLKLLIVALVLTAGIGSAPVVHAAAASKTATAVLSCSEADPGLRESARVLSNRLRFARERQQTALELEKTYRELRSGAKKRALWMTAGFSVAFSALSYEGMVLLSKQAARAGAGALKRAGSWAAEKVNGGSVARFLTADSSYNAAKIVMAEKVAGLLGPKELRFVSRIGTNELPDYLPPVLELTPKEVDKAYEEIGREHAQLETLVERLTPKPRDRRKIMALGWDDFLDFRTLTELAAAKARLYGMEVTISELLLRKVELACTDGRVSGVPAILHQGRPVPRGSVSTLQFRYSKNLEETPAVGSPEMLPAHSAASRAKQD